MPITIARFVQSEQCGWANYALFGWNGRRNKEWIGWSSRPKAVGSIKRAERTERWVGMYRKEGEISFHKPKGRPRKAENEQSEHKRLRMENVLPKKFHSELRKLALAQRNIGRSSTTKKTSQ